MDYDLLFILLLIFILLSFISFLVLKGILYYVYNSERYNLSKSIIDLSFSCLELDSSFEKMKKEKDFKKLYLHIEKEIDNLDKEKLKIQKEIYKLENEVVLIDKKWFGLYNQLLNFKK